MSRQQHKQHSSRVPAVTKAKQEQFLAALAAGMAPGCAAAAVEIDRSTAYQWREKDAAFGVRWDNAVNTYLDTLETEYATLAKGDPNNVGVRRQVIEYTLSHRRLDPWGNRESSNQAPTTQNNFFGSVSMPERIERLKRLGLPVPVIEPDYEVLSDDAGEDANHPSRPDVEDR